MADLLKMMRAGQLDTGDMTDDQVQELVGEMAEEASAWVPLCPSFPQLKGLSCDSVEKYREEKRKKDEACTPIYKEASVRLKQQMNLPLEILKMEYESSPFVDIWKTKRKGKEPLIDTWIRSEIESNIEISPTRSRDMDYPDNAKAIIEAGFPQDGVPESAYEQLKAMMIHRLDPIMRDLKDRVLREASEHGTICMLGMDVTGGDPRMAHLATRYFDMAGGLWNLKRDLYERDYFNNVRILSRDELFDVAVDLGKQLSGGFDLIAETYRLWAIGETAYGDTSKYRNATSEQLRRLLATDEKWQFMGQHSSNHLRKKFVDEHEITDILVDPNTIFITTPRGGHEFLSIFSYANGLRKEQIPSDIISEWEGNVEEFASFKAEGIEVEMPDNEFFGYTWLGGVSMPIKRVVIVEDIVESGDQQRRTRKYVHGRFGPDVEVLAVAACGRRWPHPNEYNQMFWSKELKDYIECKPDVPGQYAATCEEGLVNVFQEAKYGHELYDLADWRERMDAWLENYQNVTGPVLATCAFPWSITDSRPSLYLRDVYGTRWERGRARPRSP